MERRETRTGGYPGADRWEALFGAWKQESGVSRNQGAGEASWSSPQESVHQNQALDPCDESSLEGTQFSTDAGRKGENGGMSQKTLRLNTMRATISDQEELGYAPFFGLST